MWFSKCDYFFLIRHMISIGLWKTLKDLQLFVEPPQNAGAWFKGHVPLGRATSESWDIPVWLQLLPSRQHQANVSGGKWAQDQHSHRCPHSNRPTLEMSPATFPGFACSPRAQMQKRTSVDIQTTSSGRDGVAESNVKQEPKWYQSVKSERSPDETVC